MAQNILVNGNTYSNVEKLRIPKADNPSDFAVFPDTSDANLSANKMLVGSSGYDANGEKVDGNIQSIEEHSYTPGTADSEIPAGKYLAGKQIIKGDSALIPSNIVKGKTIFGIAGNATSATFSLSDGVLSIY